MPELPDVTIYVEALERRIVDRALAALRIASPFVLRTVEPSADRFAGKRVLEISRLGKRIVIGFDEDLFAVVHLMIAGRFRWQPARAKVPRKLALATFDFGEHHLVLTEAGSKKRASIHLVKGEERLRDFDRGGIDVLQTDFATFREALLRENHTVKRSLTDPRLFDGIGNAYSDEILHRARLSPVKWTSRMANEEIERLHDATRSVLTEWVELLREQAGDRFPEKVTAFRKEMAVHGKYGEPCPVCNSPVQRIVYADNETNYCARCQTEGKLLADRALSRLLREDWPRSIDEL